MEHQTDLFTEYDIEEGLIKNEKGRTFGQIRNDLRAMFFEEEQTWDYFTVDMLKTDKTWPLDVHRVLVYTVPGGSEGFYLHLDVKVGDAIENVVLVKFLGSAEDALKVQERIWRRVFA